MSAAHLAEPSSRVQDTVAACERTNDASSYDEALKSIRDLQLAVEKPGDFAARIRFQAFQNIAILVLAEMGVLQVISGKARAQLLRKNWLPRLDTMLHSSVWIFRCREKLWADDPSTEQLMRLITASGMCEEVGMSTYRSNQMLEVLADPGQIAGQKFMLDVQFRTGSRITDYLRAAQLDRCKTSNQSACQFAFNGKTFWQLLEESPERKANFDLYMKAARRGGQVQLWHQRYPPAAKLRDETLKKAPPALLMVDVGGGVGGQVGAFRKQYPDLPGRCVLQDLPETIKNNTSPLENVELMAYDFFTPQPLKGARIYLFRSVCHDWDDAHTRQLLSNTVAEMDPAYSRLLIDEWVLPDVGVDLKAANMDVNMLLLFNGMERTESQWVELLGDVGLEIVRIWRTEGAVESVIETRVKRQM
ncbi:putative O-methyltransferase [Teratosphaeria nubilosa]|uniref:Putative O-methyltransferase n=1 Tax=Teratosphaeria nubilosa TaxID=161662 RepID=A0A6G1LFT7_9PEZI|nr:putative O-methyltransferase [Teratosphaeria nubilosa]